MKPVALAVVYVRNSVFLPHVVVIASWPFPLSTECLNDEDETDLIETGLKSGADKVL
ncbi:UDP-N-acetylmuramate--L-alanine ligase, partial [Clarias magur]